MKRLQGFTLIELMIVVAIVGILGSIAYPSYQESIRKSRRGDAKGALLGFANAMERHFTETNNYCGAGTDDAAGDCEDAKGVPTIYSATSPVDGTTAYYNLEITAVTEVSYTLSAIPTGAQTGDSCGTLTIQNTGAKGVSSSTVASCW